MPKKVKSEAQRLDDLLTAIQDLFILEGLRAGMMVEDVRKILRIEMRRVNIVSGPLKKAQRRAAKKTKP
jgi:hypothetical protein